jgi:hypothetical protein
MTARGVHAVDPRISKLALALACAIALCAGPTARVAAGESPIPWASYGPEVFERAAKEKRYILLDMEAVWCHWCHVMDRETYTDPEVLRLIDAHYVPVKVDQESRPDLAIRYERYGWPATIILAPDGTEIVKRRGFIRADVLASILAAVIEDPSPVPGIEVVLPDAYAPDAVLAEDAREALTARHVELLDIAKGGIDGPYRYLPWEAAELALERARAGDASQAAWLRTTLRESYALIDPAFGGVYQYSVEQRWDRPHFEKIMSFQAENLRTYALAHGALGEAGDLDAARAIVRYVDEFLTSPEGAFYTSQDADLERGVHSAEYFDLRREARLERGVPRVDTHRYARENGWMIEALATAYEVTGERAVLDRAVRAAEWIVAQRALPSGGFRHDEVDAAGPFLGDTLAMGRAALALYRATGERAWLGRAVAAAGFIDRTFRHDAAGYLAARPDGSPVAPLPQFDENAKLARFANLLHHYSGDAAHRAIAEHALRFAATEDIYGPRREIGALLLADAELREDPLHLTVVGKKGDGEARALYEAALRETRWYKRVEWWDRREGPLMNDDVTYPDRPEASVYVCNDRACSAPLKTAEALRAYLDRQRAKPTAPGVAGGEAQPSPTL